jgi:uncharacterized phiE125 gp8 family phage protein
MHLSVVTPPATEPVTFSEVYDHLHNPPQNDAMISRLMVAARTEAETYTNRAFIEQTLRMTGPSCRYTSLYTSRNCHGIQLLRQPIIAIQSVSYYDYANALQVIDDSNYYVTEDGFLRFISSYSYPSVYAREDAFRIDYVAGYVSSSSPPIYAENVPEPIKQAILLGVELQYSPLTPVEREAMERTRTALLGPYRVFEIA